MLPHSLASDAVILTVDLDWQRTVRAHAGDAVLIAGKGRQTFQILADRVLPFDDSAIARSWLRRLRATRRTSA